jgi:S1-C subfamily serine protease
MLEALDMKNLKFGASFLGLILVVATLVTGVNAQPRERDFRVFDGRGSQLGVMVSDLDARATTGGVKVDEVNEDGPAARAGIKAGDIVVDYEGERVRSARQFTRLVQETPEGRPVAIGIMRDGKKQTVNATPETGRMTWNFGPDVDRAFREAERGMRDLPEFDFDFRDMPRRFEYRYRAPEGFGLPAPGSRFPASRGRLGVSVQSITPELAEYFGAKNGGALVSSVTKESAAAKAGIKAGDVIVSINGKAVSDSGDVARALGDISGEATIVVLRDKKELTLKATLSARSGAL